MTSIPSKSTFLLHSTSSKLSQPGLIPIELIRVAAKIIAVRVLPRAALANSNFEIMQTKTHQMV